MTRQRIESPARVPFVDHLGLELQSAADGQAEVRVDLHDAHFNAWDVAHGGVLVINHPFSTPLKSSFSMARADLSWRPFTSDIQIPEEIAAVVAAVLAGVITAGLAGVAALSGVGADQPTTTLLVEGGNRGW